MMLLEREDALRELSRTLTASQTLGQFASVSGEAGVGKTALVAAFVAREPGVVPFLWGACEALATPRPLGPLLDMAHDLGDDVPALVAAEGARHQLFAAFVAGLARRKAPALVVFEDVHWADAATLDLLRYVGRRATRIRALIVLTWRSDEVGARPPAEPGARRAAARIHASARAAAFVARIGCSDGRGHARREESVRAHRRQPVLRHRAVAS